MRSVTAPRRRAKLLDGVRRQPHNVHMAWETIAQLLGDDEPLALFIRHAERSEITSMVNALEALLTERGKEEARRLGRDLARFGPVRIYSSPVERCRQTAEQLARGIGEAGGTAERMGELFDLGGPYIAGDWHEVMSHVVSLGSQESFLRQWIDGSLPPGLMTPFPEAAARQLNIMAVQLEDPSWSYINVSHDWNLAIMRECYFGLSHEEISMPPFLDGMAVHRRGDGLSLYYRGRSINVPGAMPAARSV